MVYILKRQKHSYIVEKEDHFYAIAALMIKLEWNLYFKFKIIKY